MARNYKDVPVEVTDVEDEVKEDEIVFAPALAALVLRAYTLYSGSVADAEDNQAERLVDGTVQLYLKQPDRSHKKVYVSVPDSVTFKIADPAV